MHLYLHMDVFVRRPLMKCAHNETAGDEVYPATKWLVTKCPRDEMAGDKLYPRRNCWRRSVPATKWQATERWRQKGVYPDSELATTCSQTPQFPLSFSKTYSAARAFIFLAAFLQKMKRLQPSPVSLFYYPRRTAVTFSRRTAVTFPRR